MDDLKAKKAKADITIDKMKEKMKEMEAKVTNFSDPFYSIWQLFTPFHRTSS